MKLIPQMISTVLIAVLVHGSIAAQTQSVPIQDVAKIQEVLRKAQDKNKAVKITLNKKIENQLKFSGKVSETSDTDFTCTDQKTGNTMTVAYADVQEVKQKGMSKGVKIAIGVGVGIALWIGIVIAVAGGLPD